MLNLFHVYRLEFDFLERFKTENPKKRNQLRALRHNLPIYPMWTHCRAEPSAQIFTIRPFCKPLVISFTLQHSVKPSFRKMIEPTTNKNIIIIIIRFGPGLLNIIEWPGSRRFTMQHFPIFRYSLPISSPKKIETIYYFTYIICSFVHDTINAYASRRETFIFFCFCVLCLCPFDGDKEYFVSMRHRYKIYTISHCITTIYTVFMISCSVCYGHQIVYNKNVSPPRTDWQLPCFFPFHPFITPSRLP